MKKPTVTSLTKKLDAIFSQFIRLRDCDKNGMGTCCTCGKFLSWRDANAGHYIVRQFRGSRWDEANVNFQCPYCNKWLDGNAGEYTKFLENKYGIGIISELLKKKNDHTVIKVDYLQNLISHYTERVKALKKEKGII